MTIEPQPLNYAGLISPTGGGQTARPSKGAVWVGRVLSGLPALLFIFSGGMKLSRPPQMVEGFAHMGLPEYLILPIGILELACTLIYLIPQTAVLGAILLTGYLGGAICTHLRIGEPFVMHVVIGVVIWLGLFLRDVRLRALIPLRRTDHRA